MNMNWYNIVKLLSLYILESFGITLIVYVIAKKSISLQNLSWLFVSITSILLILDLLAPDIGISVRQGQGFVAGFSMVGGDGSEEEEGNVEVLPYTKDILSSY